MLLDACPLVFARTPVRRFGIDYCAQARLAFADRCGIRRIASEIDNVSHDLISGLYSLRLMPLAVGKTFRMSVSDSGLVYEIPVRVTAREQQRTMFGKLWCFRVVPEVFGRNRLIEREGDLTIWITDDARRLPVRAVANTPYGKVDIRLKTAKNLR